MDMTEDLEASLVPIAKAVDFIVEAAERQPSLEEAAAAAGLSPTYFQRVFAAGVGVSPKRFLQALTAGEARAAMAAGESVEGAALASGLSGASRLHDLFLVTEAMTPGAYRKKGAGVDIRYGVAPGPFGATLVGATAKGICWLSFGGAGADGFRDAEAAMRADWPAARFVRDDDHVAPIAAQAFAAAMGQGEGAPAPIHVAGTNFQLKVWEALMRIPFGACVTYGDVARAIGSPKASRAVGAAVGANNVSVLIPCHRVIAASAGKAYHYRWGAARKRALLALEEAVSAGPDERVAVAG